MTPEKDILLIRPPAPEIDGPLGVRANEPLGLCQLASFLRSKGMTADILDLAGTTSLDDSLVKGAGSYRLVGFSVFPSSIEESIALTRAVKRQSPKTPVVWGGGWPTFNHLEIIRDHLEVEFIIRSEGEFPLWELLERLDSPDGWPQVDGLVFRANGQTCVNEWRAPIDDLDALPFPSRDLVAEPLGRGKSVSVLTSRGCIYKCSYCSVKEFYRTSDYCPWRPRSPQNVVDELEVLTNEHGVRSFKFVDDEFFGTKPDGRARAVKLADLILERGLEVDWSIECHPNSVDEDLMAHLKRAGLVRVFLGIEAGSQDVLNRFRKGLKLETSREAIATLKKLDIKIGSGFMMFNPFTTLDTLSENLDFLELHRIFGATSIVSRTILFKGHDLTETMIKEGRLKGDYKGYEYKTLDPRAESVHDVMLKVVMDWEFDRSFIEGLEDSVPGNRYDEYQGAVGKVPISIMRSAIMEARAGHLDSEESRLLFAQRAIDEGRREMEKLAASFGSDRN